MIMNLLKIFPIIWILLKKMEKISTQFAKVISNCMTKFLNKENLNPGLQDLDSIKVLKCRNLEGNVSTQHYDQRLKDLKLQSCVLEAIWIISNVTKMKLNIKTKKGLD